MSLLEQLLDWDRDLFYKVNGQWTNSFFDKWMPPIRNANIWLPLYVFFISFALINYGRRGLFWVLFAILTVATSDLVSSWGVKDLIFRYRPCRDSSLTAPVRFLVEYCPMSSSFTSSHATNHFAMAMFIFITLRSDLGKWIGLIFLWAFLIGYAQVYVGVHYPFDILGGALLGMGIGYFWGRFFHHHFPLNRSLSANR